jgi:hypothetical protein
MTLRWGRTTLLLSKSTCHNQTARALVGDKLRGGKYALSAASRNGRRTYIRGAPAGAPPCGRSRSRPLLGTERPWTSYSAISPFSDSTSNGGCRFSGVWPRCTRFGWLDSGRVIRDGARGTGDAGLRIGFTSVPHTWACARTWRGCAASGLTARPLGTATRSMPTSPPCTLWWRGGPRRVGRSTELAGLCACSGWKCLIGKTPSPR